MSENEVGLGKVQRCGRVAPRLGEELPGEELPGGELPGGELRSNSPTSPLGLTL